MQCVWCGSHNDPERLKDTGICQACGELQAHDGSGEDFLVYDERANLNVEGDHVVRKSQIDNTYNVNILQRMAILLAIKPDRSNKRNTIYIGTICLCGFLFLLGVTQDFKAIDQQTADMLSMITGYYYSGNDNILEQKQLLHSLSLSGVALGIVMIAYGFLSKVRK
jgi:hypothetical protein